MVAGCQHDECIALLKLCVYCLVLITRPIERGIKMTSWDESRRTVRLCCFGASHKKPHSRLSSIGIGLHRAFGFGIVMQAVIPM